MTEPRYLSTLEEKVAPEHTALLVIDMSNDFLDPRGKTATRAGRPLDAAQAVIPTMARLVDGARRGGVRVVFVQHTTLPGGASASGPWLEARSRARYSVEDICLDGTWGQRTIEELPVHEGDLVVRKYRYGGFAGTDLDMLLRSAGVRAVVCAGVSTNACVEATAREAFSNDYYVAYAEDACASWDMDLHRATLATAAARYATVIDTDALVAEWGRARTAPEEG